MMDDDNDDDDDDYVQLGKTGVNGINRASKERQSDLRVNLGDYAHKECRATYTNGIFHCRAKLDHRLV